MRVCGRKLRWDFLERRLSRLCRNLGWHAATHPWPFIILPVVITLASIGGWAFKKDYYDAVEMYTPQGAQSRCDQAAIEELFPHKDGSFLPGRVVVYRRECTVVAVSRDGGNILRSDIAESVKRMNEYISNDIRIEHNGQNYTYQNLCMKSGSSCYGNPFVYLIPTLFARANDPYTNLSFPTTVYDNNQYYYLGAALGGVSLDPVSKRIVDAKAWQLTYKLKTDNVTNELSKLWEVEFELTMLKFRDPYVNVSFFHSQAMDREVLRNADDLMPRFSIMFILLVFFAVACTITFVPLKTRTSEHEDEKKDRATFWGRLRACIPKCKGKLAVDWVLSRPGLAMIGVIGAGMGVASSIGIIFYCGMIYNNIVSVMPFLIVAVRLDNTFLMIAALDNTKRTVDVRERISEAMAEAAVSITMTVMTDIFSFAFGLLTDFYAVQIFCLYTTVAIFITWIYQLTFLLGFLVLYARWEEQQRHCIALCVVTVPADEYESQSIWKRLFCLGSRPPVAHLPTLSVATALPVNGSERKPSVSQAAETEEHGTAVSRWFRDVYGTFLMKTASKVTVLLVLCAYWAVALYGCVKIRQGLEPSRLVVDDSFVIPYFGSLNDYFYQTGLQIQLVFFNPGDLTSASRRQDILRTVVEFSRIPHATGMEGVDFWLVALDNYLTRNEDVRLRDLPPEKFYQKLNYFLSFNENFRYRTDVAWRNGTGPGDNDTNPVAAMRVMLGARGFDTLDGQRETTSQCRKVAAAHPQFNISTFHVMFMFVDQYEDIWPNVAQEIYSSLACMIGIALLLIPHPVCSLWVTFSVLSIDAGVIGFMTLWGLNMDTISMITIIMSIGFSVDFSAHIAYAYVVNIHEKPDDRVKKALGALGWPVLQGGVATVLGVIFLADLHSYMVVAFFKTVFLVIVIGLMHGLVFLPVLLNVLMPATCCGFQCIRSASPKIEHSTAPKVSITEQVVPMAVLNGQNNASPSQADKETPGAFKKFLGGILHSGRTTA